MKIKELDQHCGDCGVVEYCGNPFGYCLCHDERFQDLDDEEYRKMADACEGSSLMYGEWYRKCVGCNEGDCSACENEDFFVTQMADAIYSQLETA